MYSRICTSRGHTAIYEPAGALDGPPIHTRTYPMPPSGTPSAPIAMNAAIGVMSYSIRAWTSPYTAGGGVCELRR